MNDSLVCTTFSSAYPAVALAGSGEPCNGECLMGLEAADLTLGKPCLFPLSSSATLAQALTALKYNKDIDALSVWVDNCSEGDVAEQTAYTRIGSRAREYRCGGMVTTSDIITFLAKDENLLNPGAALNTPLSVLFPSLSQAVEHVHPRTSLCQALEIMLDGVQHLVVPITRRQKQGKPLNVPEPLLPTDLPSGDYCWITQEDVVRHLLSCLGAFYPVPMISLEKLCIINTAVLMVDADSPAIMIAPLIERASQEMTAVAVVTGLNSGDWAPTSSLEANRPRLAGDISTQTLRGCSETAAAALATLSVREFLHYVHDAGGPSQQLVEKVANNLAYKALPKTVSVSCPSLADFDTSSGQLSPMSSGVSTDEASDVFDGMLDYSSSDEELGRASSGGPLEPSLVALANLKLGKPSVSHPLDRTLITCRPHSSLVAVMAQALAHRVNHVWVTDEEGGLVGIVTYTDIIEVLLSQLHSY